jgi:hypothetical protein
MQIGLHFFRAEQARRLSMEDQPQWINTVEGTSELVGSDWIIDLGDAVLSKAKVISQTIVKRVRYSLRSRQDRAGMGLAARECSAGSLPHGLILEKEDTHGEHVDRETGNAVHAAFNGFGQ